MMSLISFNQTLVRSPDEMRLLSRTYVGMAHFAGTGPDGTTCRECEFWQPRNPRWTTSTGGGVGVPVPVSCRKFKQLMCAKKSDAIPHDTPSCKHFQPAEKPQPLERPKAND